MRASRQQVPPVCKRVGLVHACVYVCCLCLSVSGFLTPCTGARVH
jgi:cytochrome b561